MFKNTFRKTPDCFKSEISNKNKDNNSDFCLKCEVILAEIMLSLQRFIKRKIVI